MAIDLTMTCGPYDRSKALIDGTVKPEGINLAITVNADDNGRQTRAARGDFDVAEFYVGRYITDLPFRAIGFTAIPIFVKRMFRHSYIYVNTRRGIRAPSDLNGRRVGLQSWFTTAAIWTRGILADDYGLDLHSITWVADRAEHIEGWRAPPWLKLDYVPAGRTQLDMLAAGEIDASMSTEMLAPGRHPDVDFLFPNHAALERDYYRRTGFFPIMHVLLIRNAVLEQHPWVALSLFKAWEQSKQECYKWLEWQRIHQTSLWYRALWEEEQAAGGPDFYKWGFRATRPEVDKLLDYSHRLGLTARKHEPEEMFWPSTLET
jgi:4,5-dihydroxyphthalate decarboxylase